MVSRFIFFIALVWLALFPTAASAKPEVYFVLPFDGAVLRDSTVLVLYETPAAVKTVVSLDNFKLKEGKLVGGNVNDLHHITVNLKEGKNTLVWTDPETEKSLGQMELYYIPPQSPKRVKGAKIKNYSFHKTEFEKRCNECHPMPEEVETVPGKPMSPAGKVCSSCHPTVGNAKKAHEPTATYDCFRCHATNYKPSRFAIRNSQAALCGECHKNFFERVMGDNKYVHGPIAMGNCDTCHDAHGGEAKGILREPVNSLCLRCHAETVLQEVPNSIHRTLECTKCHNPHGSQNAQLTVKPIPELCLNCHEDPVKKYDGHPLAGHPVAAPVDPSRPGRPMSCFSCHSVHGRPDISALKILENQDQQRKFCTRCHY